MIHKISLRNVAFDEQKFVIATCGFTFQGYCLLIKKYGIEALQIHFEGDEVYRRDRENILINQNAHIVVFLGKGIVALLESLKRLASVLNALPAIRGVTLYGDIPDSWLYRTLGSLLNSSHQLALIRIASVSDVITCFHTCNDGLQDRSRLLCERYPDYSCQENLKGLTRREIDVLLNIYRGMSVKELCGKLGVSDKTIYAHRKEGMQKLHYIRQWLNEPYSFKAERSIKKSKLKS